MLLAILIRVCERSAPPARREGERSQTQPDREGARGREAEAVTEGVGRQRTRCGT